MTSPFHTKRIIGDIKLLTKDPIEGVNVYFSDGNMLLWYFLIFGTKGTDYEGGEYIGHIKFTTMYPEKPPSFYMYTPTGRFKSNHELCLSNSKFHTDEWSPAWTISAIIRGFVSIMNEEDTKGSYGHLCDDKDTRKKYMLNSIKWNNKYMPDIYKKLKNEYLGYVPKNEPVKQKIPPSVILKNLNTIIKAHGIKQKKLNKHIAKYKKLKKLIVIEHKRILKQLALKKHERN